MAEINCIRFDWAAKRILRDKANFAVLEGVATGIILKSTGLSIEEIEKI